jgi:hypothetical protein
MRRHRKNPDALDPSFQERSLKSGHIASGRVGGVAIGIVLAVCAAAVPLVWLWGFTVDDALVSARVAHRIAVGHGYRFNANGPIVDAVTPLGWAYLLAPFATSGVVSAFCAAKWIGAIGWLCGAAFIGQQIARTGESWRRFLPLLVLAACGPIAAWAAAGMETGLVLLGASLALARSRWAALAAGLCAAWRPELVAWAIVLGTGTAFVSDAFAAARPSRRLAHIALALACSVGPAIAVAATRWVVFGNPAPLAALAKPSDASHGLRYALAALIWTGPPWLILSPKLRGLLDRHQIVLLIAALAHWAALVAVGGDWMALFRLAVPVLPSLLVVGAAIAERDRIWATLIRVSLALSACLAIIIDRGPGARRVGAERAQLIGSARPVLRGARHIAAVDVGWVGAASDATLIDLAGITDPTIARFVGGHTSKRIPEGWLERREVDTLVLWLAPGEHVRDVWYETLFSKQVEQRVAWQLRELPLAWKTTLPLGERPYLVVRFAGEPP